MYAAISIWSNCGRVGGGHDQLAVLAGDFLLAKASIGLSTIRNGEVGTSRTLLQAMLACRVPPYN